MPSPAADISSRHELTLKERFFPRRFGSCYEAGCKRPRARARCPKGCPRAKTLRMANDRQKTCDCSAMA
eukprot:1937707-Amphidinium_carterae.1